VLVAIEPFSVHCIFAAKSRLIMDQFNSTSKKHWWWSNKLGSNWALLHQNNVTFYICSQTQINHGI
jgi:hypothetical protein